MTRGSEKRAAMVLGAVLFVSYAYFYQAGGWNQNSRFALVRAIIEQHTLQIDAYRAETGDRALWKDHYYSDKAPGASLAAVAPVVAARGLVRLVRVNPKTPRAIAWMSYVATVATSGVFTIIAALIVFRLSIAWGFTQNAALFAATAYGLASPAWCYATLFMGHALTAGCLMLAFMAAVDIGERWHAFLVGLWIGFAVLSEFPAAVPGLFIIVMAVAAARNRSLVLTRVIAGGVIPALVLLAYNTAAFDAPFHLGYASEEGFEELRTGFFGITSPAWSRLQEILVGNYRGLLPLAPLLALTPIGLVVLGRARARLRPVLTAAAIVAFYFMLNASYYYWEGGWAYGPRHVTPALPFLALGLAPLWDRWGRAGRVLLSAGWIWGAALTLVAVSTTPQPPSAIQAPVRELLWPAFRDGDLSLNNQSFTDYRADQDLLRDNPDGHAAWNLGQLAGLHGLPSLLPLGLIWMIGGWLLLRPD